MQQKQWSPVPEGSGARAHFLGPLKKQSRERTWLARVAHLTTEKDRGNMYRAQR